MIANALVFVLGALVAGLVSLVVFPAFTRRAARLARREMEQRLPRSLSEMAAEKDALRAEYAARTAKVEVELRAARKALVDERLARADEAAELLLLRADRRGYAEGLAAAEKRVTDAQEQARASDEALARTLAENRDLERRLAGATDRIMEAESRAAEAERLASEMRLALVATEASAAARADMAMYAPQPPDARPATPSAAFDPAGLAFRFDATPAPEPKRAIVQRIESVPPIAADAPRGSPSDRAEPVPDRMEERIRSVLGVGRKRRAAASPDAAALLPATVNPAPPPALPAPEPVAALPAPTPDSALRAVVAGGDARREEAEHARLVEDLAARLRNLKARNAASRSRVETTAAGSAGDGSGSKGG